MQLLIDNFGVARVFGQHNIEYFAEVTHIEIHVRETFKYQYSYPPEDILPRKYSLWAVFILLVVTFPYSTHHQSPSNHVYRLLLGLCSCIYMYEKYHLTLGRNEIVNTSEIN